MSKDFKSRNKIRLASLRDPSAQPGEQIEQAAYNSTPGIYSSGGAQQFEVPRTPPVDGRPAEHIQQNGYYSAPGSYTPAASPQFKVPPTPFLGIPVTPMSDIPTTKVPAVPLTP